MMRRNANDDVHVRRIERNKHRRIVKEMAIKL